jgi:hypothetical protein
MLLPVKQRARQRVVRDSILRVYYPLCTLRPIFTVRTSILPPTPQAPPPTCSGHKGVMARCSGDDVLLLLSDTYSAPIDGAVHTLTACVDGKWVAVAQVCRHRAQPFHGFWIDLA